MHLSIARSFLNEQLTRRALNASEPCTLLPNQNKPASSTKFVSSSRTFQLSRIMSSKSQYSRDDRDRHGVSSSNRDHRDADPDRQSDREERDRLDSKLKRSEQERNRNLASRKESRRHESEYEIQEIRKKSRNQYLKSRSQKQLEILEGDIKDVRDLSAGLVLSQKERDELEDNLKLLEIVKKHQDASKKFKSKQYFMPDGQNLEQMDIDDEAEAGLISEHKRWDSEKFDAVNVAHRSKLKKSQDDKDFIDMALLLLHDDKEFLDRVRRGDTFEEYRVDQRQIDKEARDRERKLMLETRKNLPVYKHKDKLLQDIANNQIIIIEGQTGCGKTTQIPQYLHEAGYTKTEGKDGELKMVGCTQPRRVAAMSVAARVSQEIGSKLGHTVGYSIRFEDCTSEATVIKYMTDGMLLRELLDDPTLSKYSAIIVDEAHERTLHTDILLTLLKDVTRARLDFKLIISSATLDESKFSEFFNNPPVSKIEGRLFDVDKQFMKPDQNRSTGNIVELCLSTVFQVHRSQPVPGDILVFLPGQEEIEELAKEIENRVKKLGSSIKELLIRPIFANLPTEMQAKVFNKTPPGARKVVIATNIAETSLTIDGIVYVIDPGYCKQNRFSSKTGMETLEITRISKASADQRAGRAGRNRPGVCLRLYTKDEYKEFEASTQPEIQRLNLANVVLLLKTMRINNVIDFDYMDRPSTEVLTFAIEQLTALGALDKSGELTLLGRRMAEFPLDPKMSKSIISSEAHKCSEEILSIMSMLSVNGSIFYKPKEKAVHAEASRKGFFSVTGDHLMLLKVYEDWAASDYSKQWCHEKFIQHKSMCRARDVRDQLEKLCEKVEIKLLSNPGDTIAIRKAILGGFFHNVAKISRDGGSYRTIKKNQCVHIHPTSAVRDAPPRWVVFNEIKKTSQEYMRIISEIEPSWLVEVAPYFYSEEEIAELSKKKMPKIVRGKTKAQLNPKPMRR